MAPGDPVFTIMPAPEQPQQVTPVEVTDAPSQEATTLQPETTPAPVVSSEVVVVETPVVSGEPTN